MPIAAWISVLALAAAAAGTPPATPVYSPAGAGCSVEIPAGWVEGPALSERGGILLGPGRTQGPRPSIRVEFHSGGPRSAADYLRRIRSLDERPSRKSATEPVVVAGLKGTRVRIVRRPPPGRNAAVRKDAVVIPEAKGFHVLIYAASTEDFQGGLPAFERVLATFRPRANW